MAPSRGLLGAALVLAPAPGSTDQPRLDLRIETVDRMELTPATSPAHALLEGNALAPCLPFFEALARRDGAVVTLALGRSSVLRTRLSV
jgi:hypothetical protein